jgi:hypothetical protein
MTRTEFDAQYKLLNQTTEGSVRSFHAISAQGAVVMAHFLSEPPARPSAAAVLRALEELPDEQRRRVLEVLTVDGAAVLLTRFILDFQSLELWLRPDGSPLPEPSEGEAGAGPVAGPADPGPTADAVEPRPTERSEPVPAGTGSRDEAPDEATGPGEFTRMFQAQLHVEPSEPARPAAPADEADPAPLPDPPSAGSLEPGEFTRLFAAASPPLSPPPASRPPAPEAAGDEPSEFTRLFGAAEPPVPRRPTPAPSARHEDPFSYPVQEPEPARTPHGIDSPEPEDSPSLPGLSFGAPARREDAQPAPPAAPEPGTPQAGEFTSIFGRAAGPMGAPGGPPAPPPAPPPASAQPTARPYPPFSPVAPPAAAPGEYTRIIAAQSIAAAPPPAAAGDAPPAAEPSGPARRARWPLVAGLLLVVVLLAVFLYFLVSAASAPQ